MSCIICFFFFKQKTAYEMRISDWSSDVCSSDLPSGDYTLDFYCSDARLAIEIDGEAHGRGDRPMRDARRDRWFETHGIATMRIPAREVLRDLDGVVRGIVAAAQARLPLHHPAAPDGPPPRDKLGAE